MWWSGEVQVNLNEVRINKATKLLMTWCWSCAFHCGADNSGTMMKNNDDFMCMWKYTAHAHSLVPLPLSCFVRIVCLRLGSWMEWVLSPSEMTDQGNNNQNISCNPFAALFSSLADAKQFASGQKPQQQSAEPPCEYSELLQSSNEKYSQRLCGLVHNNMYIYEIIWFHTHPLYLVSQWRTQERASQSQKTLCQTALMTMTTPWRRSAAPSGPGRSCVNSSMSTTWSREYFSSLWTTVSKRRKITGVWSVTYTPSTQHTCVGLRCIDMQQLSQLKLWLSPLAETPVCISRTLY